MLLYTATPLQGREILYFLLHCIYLTAIAATYFPTKDSRLKKTFDKFIKYSALVKIKPRPFTKKQGLVWPPGSVSSVHELLAVPPEREFPL